MRQTSRQDITQKVGQMLAGKLTREELFGWASAAIQKDERFEKLNAGEKLDLDTWCYLSQICFMSDAEDFDNSEYLYADDELRDVALEYQFEPVSAKKAEENTVVAKILDETCDDFAWLQCPKCGEAWQIWRYESVFTCQNRYCLSELKNPLSKDMSVDEWVEIYKKYNV